MNGCIEVCGNRNDFRSVWTGGIAQVQARRRGKLMLVGGVVEAASNNNP